MKCGRDRFVAVPGAAGLIVVRLSVPVLVFALAGALPALGESRDRRPDLPVPTPRPAGPPNGGRLTPPVLAPARPPVAAPVAPGSEAAVFRSWLAAFQAEALGRGIRQAVLDRAFAGVTPNPRVVELDRRQPEGRVGFSDYLNRTVTTERIAEGRRLMALHRTLLGRIGRAYGVSPHLIVSLWGIETSFGTNTGGFSVIRSLATLAFEGRRAELFRAELLAALQILQQQRFTAEMLTGSWAGAMGQCQFMPSSYLKFAVDQDGDGHPNLWTSTADVFASTANYLGQLGWRSDQGWGRPVRLPPGFDQGQITYDLVLPLTEWQKRGVRLLGGGDLPAAELVGSLTRPGGPTGTAWLVYPNFRAVMKWNRSTYFAMAVLQLADAIGP